MARPWCYFAAHEPGPLEAAATFTKIVAGAESNVAVGPRAPGPARGPAEPAGRRLLRPLCARRAGSRGRLRRRDDRHHAPHRLHAQVARARGCRPGGRVPPPRLGGECAGAGGFRRQPLPRGQPSARHRHHAGALAELRRARRARDAPHARPAARSRSTPTCASSSGPAARPWPSTSTASPAWPTGCCPGWPRAGCSPAGRPEDIAAFLPGARRQGGGDQARRRGRCGAPPRAAGASPACRWRRWSTPSAPAMFRRRPDQRPARRAGLAHRRRSRQLGRRAGHPGGRRHGRPAASRGAARRSGWSAGLTRFVRLRRMARPEFDADVGATRSRSSMPRWTWPRPSARPGWRSTAPEAGAARSRAGLAALRCSQRPGASKPGLLPSCPRRSALPARGADRQRRHGLGLQGQPQRRPVRADGGDQVRSPARRAHRRRGPGRRRAPRWRGSSIRASRASSTAGAPSRACTTW